MNLTRSTTHAMEEALLEILGKNTYHMFSLAFIAIKKHKNGSIDVKIAKYALEALNVDAYGLDEMDNKILATIIDKFKGGPVGISTIATAVSESTETVEEVYEPFLIQQGFIMRTPRGREVTELAYKHLGRIKNPTQGGLF